MPVRRGPKEKSSRDQRLSYPKGVGSCRHQPDRSPGRGAPRAPQAALCNAPQAQLIFNKRVLANFPRRFFGCHGFSNLYLHADSASG